MQSKQKEYHNLIRNSDYSILIDYDYPVFRKRLWVINNKTRKIEINTFVSHAFNSGIIYARKFSNTFSSEFSTYGSFLTNSIYTGQYGYGMKIDGLEPGINDNAMKRSIVFHSHFFPFYSKGCYMTFPADNKKIINLTKGGSLIYVHKDSFTMVK